MAVERDSATDRERRFHDAALPYLDDVFTLARYLMRNVPDAEDAVQECFMRALKHFGSYRGPSMKAWLLTILRNICNAEFARRGKQEMLSDDPTDETETEHIPMWQEPQASAEAVMLRKHDDNTIRELIAALPAQFREVIVLREINGLSYQEIAQVAGMPVGTVMSRLARARAMLRTAWDVAEGVMP